MFYNFAFACLGDAFDRYLVRLYEVKQRGSSFGEGRLGEGRKIEQKADGLGVVFGGRAPKGDFGGRRVRADGGSQKEKVERRADWKDGEV